MSSATDGDAVIRFANVFVVVAVVAMLIGAILIIMARDAYVVDVEPGATETLFEYEAPSWDPWGHPLRVVVHGPANVTVVEDGEASVDDEVVVRAEESTGAHEPADPQNLTLGPGQRATWSETAGSGEAWKVTVTNDGPQTVMVAGAVHDHSAYIVGGILVGIGVLGFVAYRLGMRRSD